MLDARCVAVTQRLVSIAKGKGDSMEKHGRRVAGNLNVDKE